jgi:hypothetical protein
VNSVRVSLSNSPRYGEGIKRSMKPLSIREARF